MATTKQSIDFKNIALYLNPHNIDLSSHSGSHYGVWTLHFVDITKGIDAVQYWDRYSYTGRRVRNLRFRAQWERDHKEKGVYGNRLQIHGQDEIEYVEDALALVDILKRVEKVRQNLLIQPTTFGQYVALMCNGLGIKKFVYPTEQREVRTWSGIDQYYHQCAKADELLVRMIDREVEKTYFPEDRQIKSA